MRVLTNVYNKKKIWSGKKKNLAVYKTNCHPVGVLCSRKLNKTKPETH